mmetsp:Transcript_24704/g.24258  ORF Transcript_24704/g.24258 Transcript_24704/m.24258 type:complete len:101 (-) Transcript_24704:21-323(-)
MKKELFQGDESNTVQFPAFMKYLEESSTFDYPKNEYQQSLDLFDNDRNGEANIDDIKRVIKTYSKLSESEINHFLDLNNFKYEEAPKSIDIKESVKKMYY